MDAENLDIKDRTGSLYILSSLLSLMLGAEVLVCWRQDFSRENAQGETWRNLANPGQGTCDANVHRAQEEAGAGHTGRGGCLAKGRGIKTCRNRLVVVCDPPQKPCANVNAYSF